MKDKKIKKRWLIVFSVLLALTLVVFFAIYLPWKNKAKAPIKENTVQAERYKEEAKDDLEKNDIPAAIDKLEKAVELDPTNSQTYAQKSEAEYASGDKQAAIDTVKEGLEQNPDDELLKSKLDVLEKETFNSSDFNNPRQ